MRIAQAAKDATKNVSRNKLRTLLTMLGLIVGISSVIALVGLGEGSNREVEDQMKALGGDILSTYLFESSIEYDDLPQLRSAAGVSSVAPSKSINGQVSYEKKKAGRAMIEATDGDYMAARDLTLESGRNLSSVDHGNRSKVCIVGPTVAEDLFGSTDVVGKVINVAGNRFEIVGVLDKQGKGGGMPTDSLVMIPFSVAVDLGDDGKIRMLYTKATSYEEVWLAKLSTKQYLIDDKGIASNDFMINSQDEMLGASDSVDTTMTLLLAGIASISLVVAGIGVMNVMLVSVAERVREIGIKKALGARRSDILFQFLVEALIISLAGGLLGVVAGILFGMVADSGGLRFETSGMLIGVAVGASVAVGLVFGIFPAYRASRLNPLDALRHE